MTRKCSGREMGLWDWEMLHSEPNRNSCLVELLLNKHFPDSRAAVSLCRIKKKTPKQNKKKNQWVGVKDLSSNFHCHSSMSPVQAAGTVHKINKICTYAKIPAHHFKEEYRPEKPIWIYDATRIWLNFNLQEWLISDRKEANSQHSNLQTIGKRMLESQSLKYYGGYFGNT